MQLNVDKLIGPYNRIIKGSVMNIVQYGKKYYGEIIHNRKCGPNRFAKIDFDLGGVSSSELSRRWMTHVRADKFAKDFECSAAVIATTGLGITGVPHLGTIAQIFSAIYLQQQGIPVQIVLGDLDAYNGKAVDLSSMSAIISRYRKFITSLGFDDSYPNQLRTQFDDIDVLRTMYLTGHYISDEMFESSKEDIHEYYSAQDKIDDKITYRIKLSLNLMVADFLHPILELGYNSVLVFLGIDEYKYVGLAMEVFGKMKQDNILSEEVGLSALFSEIIPGINNYPKMSKSFPDSGINTNTSMNDLEELFLHTRRNEALIVTMMNCVNKYKNDEIKSIYSVYSNDKQWRKEKEKYLEYLYDVLQRW